jgi:hypothetical protein
MPIQNSPGDLPGLLIVCPLTAARAAMLGAIQWKPGMIFTIEFFRITPNDDARATLDRLSAIVDDLDAAKVKARSLFETLEMPRSRMDCAS